MPWQLLLWLLHTLHPLLHRACVPCPLRAGTLPASPLVLYLAQACACPVLLLLLLLLLLLAVSCVQAACFQTWRQHQHQLQLKSLPQAGGLLQVGWQHLVQCPPQPLVLLLAGEQGG
jgi:hypothetical protein